MAFEIWCYWQMLTIRWTEIPSNDKALDRSGQTSTPGDNSKAKSSFLWPCCYRISWSTLKKIVEASWNKVDSGQRRRCWMDTVESFTGSRDTRNSMNMTMDKVQ